MKKAFEIIICSALILCMTGCGSVASAESSETTETSQTTATSADESVSETSSEPETETSAETMAGSDTLVIYFSATGTTKGVAEMIAEITDADMYEITAAVPYTDEDRDWNNSDSRCSVEQNDTSVRPEIGSETISLEGYSVIYIGYPIWFGQEPRIMDTFVESYDFDGITVIPFCTSGSSDIGQSGTNLEALAGSGVWLEGKRFDGGVTEDELKMWVDELNI